MSTGPYEHPGCCFCESISHNNHKQPVITGCAKHSCTNCVCGFGLPNCFVLALAASGLEPSHATCRLGSQNLDAGLLGEGVLPALGLLAGTGLVSPHATVVPSGAQVFGGLGAWRSVRFDFDRAAELSL
jgi:hypothetical protein